MTKKTVRRLPVRHLLRRARGSKRRIIRSITRRWNARRPRCCPRGCSPTSLVVLVTRARARQRRGLLALTASCQHARRRVRTGTCQCRCSTCTCRTRMVMVPDRGSYRAVLTGFPRRHRGGESLRADRSPDGGLHPDPGPHGGGRPARRGHPGLFQLYTTDRQGADRQLPAPRGGGRIPVASSSPSTRGSSGGGRAI